MASLETVSESIQQAWALLLHQWQTTASLWRDAAQLRFQKSYMEEYEPTISAALRELEQLDRVIAQARRSVE